MIPLPSTESPRIVAFAFRDPTMSRRLEGTGRGMCLSSGQALHAFRGCARFGAARSPANRGRRSPTSKRTLAHRLPPTRISCQLTYGRSAAPNRLTVSSEAVALAARHYQRSLGMPRSLGSGRAQGTRQAESSGGPHESQAMGGREPPPKTEQLPSLTLYPRLA